MFTDADDMGQDSSGGGDTIGPATTEGKHGSDSDRTPMGDL